MENQNSETQQQAVVRQEPMSVPTPVLAESKPKGKVWKIVGIIVAIIGVLSMFFIWWGSTLPDEQVETTQSSTNTMLTAEDIKNLKTSVLEEQGDYFLGTEDEQRKIVRSFVADSSKSDSVSLYTAAGTAARLDMRQEAWFLYFAARLRLQFDATRFAWKAGDEKNRVLTYAKVLDQGVGSFLNPTTTTDPQSFITAVDQIAVWEIIPADDAFYSPALYGDYIVVKEGWQDIASQTKKRFLETFAYPQVRALQDPKGLEAIAYIQEYNAGKIPASSENNEKVKALQAYLDATFYKKPQ